MDSRYPGRTVGEVGFGDPWPLCGKSSFVIAVDEAVVLSMTAHELVLELDDGRRVRPAEGSAAD